MAWQTATRTPGKAAGRVKGSDSGSGSSGQLIAVVTLNPDKVGGDIPIFYAKDKEDLEGMALVLSRTTRAMVHEIAEGVYILVKH